MDLSDGQRQQLALARALRLQPPILIMDDPTASVDTKTEHEIVTALCEAMKGRTTFVVSNRLSLLRRADLILALEGRPVLTDISFSVELGRTVALVGHTGSGKTTIAALLQKFYLPASGRVRQGRRVSYWTKSTA